MKRIDAATVHHKGVPTTFVQGILGRHPFGVLCRQEMGALPTYLFVRQALKILVAKTKETMPPAWRRKLKGD